MKYIIYFIAAVIICGGCKQLPDDNGKYLHKGTQIMTIKGCEFVIAVSDNHSIAMVHHPDCHNKQVHGGIDEIKIDGNGNVIESAWIDTLPGKIISDTILSFNEMTIYDKTLGVVARRVKGKWEIINCEQALETWFYTDSVLKSKYHIQYNKKDTVYEYAPPGVINTVTTGVIWPADSVVTLETIVE